MLKEGNPHMLQEEKEQKCVRLFFCIIHANDTAMIFKFVQRIKEFLNK